MPWHSIRNETEIERILDFVIQEGTDLEVCIPGDDVTYFSKGLRVTSESDGNSHADSFGRGREVVLRTLIPVIGNDRIRACPEADIFFPFHRFLCKFRSSFRSDFRAPLHDAYIIAFPELIEVEEKRREGRLSPGSPDFISAVLRLAGTHPADHPCELSVLNYSGHGLGLLVREKDLSLLRDLELGDLIPEIILYAEGLSIKFSAIVRHKTEVHEGLNAGVIVGLESDVNLEDFFDGISSAPMQNS